MKRVFLLLFSLLMFSVVNNLSYANSRSAKSDPKPRRVEVVKGSRVKSVNRLPKQALFMNHRGVNYYQKDSRFYRRSGSKYVVVHPPFGLRVPLLPKHFVPFVFNRINYYCANGVIYAKDNNEYVVVEPVEGMIVPELPESNVNKLNIDGSIYYEFENILYKEVPTAQGVQYRVSGTLN